MLDEDDRMHAYFYVYDLLRVHKVGNVAKCDLVQPNKLLIGCSAKEDWLLDLEFFKFSKNLLKVAFFCIVSDQTFFN